MPNKLHRVLVVDDDEAMLQTMEAILSDHFAVVACSDASVAMRLLHRESFDVVVSDWRMPGVDGLQFFDRVARLERSVSCLLITGHIEDLTRQTDRLARRRLGLLSKPFAPEQLIERVSHLAQISAMKASSVVLTNETRRRLSREGEGSG